jgi:hypothetical protein
VASERAAAQKDAAPADAEENGRKLAHINAYVERLTTVRADAERQLREDQVRLSRVEDHMRRLEDELAVLKATAEELDKMDADHLDDRRQAEREVARLRELIVESRATIEKLKAAGPGKNRSYAVIPYDGPNGTRRRPIYIECRKDNVIVQPEGITLTEEDFSPPLDSGNPLAAVLRAAREQFVKEAGGVTRDKQSEPYPLILIRPDGIAAYYAVREAIASWDADFGYEFVGDDWKLEFQAANPQLAKLEQQAVEQARIRRQVLAAAAPRAFRYGGSMGVGAGDAYSEDDNGMSGGDFGRPAAGGFGSPGEGGRGSSGRYGIVGGGSGPGEPGGGTSLGGGGGRQDARDRVATQDVRGPSSGMGSGAGNDSTGGPGEPGGVGGPAVSGGSTMAAGGTAAAPGGSPSSSAVGKAGGTFVGNHGGGAAAGGQGATAGGGDPTGSAMASGLPSLPPAKTHSLPERITPQDFIESRGPDWALGAKSATAVPVRRSIHVVVRRDRIALLPETNGDISQGKEVLLDGPTMNKADEIVAVIQKHVRDWGIAGQGLYWRPVMVLNVAPDGTQRADDLARLLKDSGIELRTNTAKPVPDITRPIWR